MGAVVTDGVKLFLQVAGTFYPATFWQVKPSPVSDKVPAMAPKTSVDGNRVMIDGLTYITSQAGANRYAVNDEFGTRLGYFMVNGRAVKDDDYGVEGAHPVLQIGRLWVAAQVAKAAPKAAAPTTKGFCRIITHEKPTEADLDKARPYRAWLKKQPGCRVCYFVMDPASGKAQTITVWETREHLAAVNDSGAPDGSAPLAGTSIDTYPMVEEP